MSIRDRILSVFSGQTPDVVPYMLDLSHWFYHKNRMPWDLSRAYEHPEHELIDYHKSVGAGFYLPNLGSFFTVTYPGDVRATVHKSDDGRRITWRLETPLGVIERTRIWEDHTYSWAIPHWPIRDRQGLRILAYALANRTYAPRWDRYHAWADAVGDCGVVYLPSGYSATGHLLNYWMGIEGTVFATCDWPENVYEAVEQINANTLTCIDLLCASPAEVILMGDNFSSDIQPPHFFDRWSRPFYVEAVRRLHAAGKYVAVHIDGRLRSALDMIRRTGADCADAVTPIPLGDLTPAECRNEAGPDFILSGGVSPDLWLPRAPLDAFRGAVIEWVSLKREGPRLLAAAGDQVPPGADEDRIRIMRNLVEEHGRY
jgi:hypothetical protein